MRPHAWRTAVAAVALAASAGARAAAGIVLVHGVLLDGSSWRGVYDVLVHDGWHVDVVQEPLTGLDDDVAATRRVIDRQQGPVVLVGHSYGGAVITVAGADPRVKALVYVAALQPDAGETAGEVAPAMHPAADHLQPTADGFVFVDPATFARDVCADLPSAQAAFLAHAQMPASTHAFDTPLAVAAWHDKPSWAVIASDDRALDPGRARWMARRAGSHVTVVASSHAVPLARPREVARVIEEAARSVR